MTLNYFVVACRILPVLLPFIYVVLQGPYFSLVLLIGGIVSIALLILQGRISSIVCGLPLFIAVSLYSVLAFLARDLLDTYFYHHAILGVFYGFPTGVYLRHLVREGKGEEVCCALALVGLFLSLVAVLVLKSEGAEQLKMWRGAELLRQNPDEAIRFFGMFQMHNVIIGTIPLTIYSMAAVPLIYAQNCTLTKGIVILGALASIYVGIETATRTAFAAAGFSVAITLLHTFWLYRWRERVKAMFTSVFVVCVLLIVLAFANLEGIDYFALAHRFSDSADDPRLVVWAESWDLCLAYPFGGGLEHLSSHLWAHHFLLDTGLTTGFLGMISLGFATAWTLWKCVCALRRCRGRLSSTSVLLTSQLVAVLVASSLMPPLASFFLFMYLVGGFMASAPAIPQKI